MSSLVPLDVGLVMGLVFAWAVLALAMAFRLLDFPDLTVEGSLPLGAAVYAVCLKSGGPVWLSIVLALVVGAMAGGLTAFLHMRFNLNKFLAGILVVAIAYSLSLRIMGSSNIGLLRLPSLLGGAERLDKNLEGPLHPVKIGMLVVLLLVVTAGLVAGLSTRRGIHLRVAGSSPEYARSLGINVPVYIVFGLAVTNMLAAFSGVLLAAHQGFADISMGHGVLILALAGMALGERLLPQRRVPYQVFVVFAALLGSVVYQVLVAYAVRAGLAATDLKLATAVLVLVVVAFRLSKDGEFLQSSQA